MYQESNNTRTQTTNAHIASNHAGIFMDYITHTWFTFILRLTIVSVNDAANVSVSISRTLCMKLQQKSKNRLCNKYKHL